MFGICVPQEMPAGKGKGRGKEDEEAVESSSSSYTEVLEERVTAAKAAPLRSAPKVAVKSRAKPAEGEIGLSSSESTTPAPRPTPGVSSGRMKPRTPTPPPRRALTKEHTTRRDKSPVRGSRNPSSSPSREGGGSKGSAKGSKTGGKSFQRCSTCWAKVSTAGSNCMKQHQHWNSNCITWGYFNRGIPWKEAQDKAQRKKERRERAAWEAHCAEAEESVSTRKDLAKKESEKTKQRRTDKTTRRHTTPSPDVRRTDRKRRKDPDTSGDEERMPKVRRQDRKTFVIQMR